MDPIVEHLVMSVVMEISVSASMLKLMQLLS